MLANRLGADPGHEVLLREAGGSDVGGTTNAPTVMIGERADLIPERRLIFSSPSPR